MFFKRVVGLIVVIFLCLISPANSVLAKSNINIAFTIDNNYPLFAMLAINSILKNNVSESDYMFYIVETNMTEENINEMKTFVEKRGQKIEFINVDTSSIDKGYDFFASPQWNGRISNIAIARLLLPDLLPKSVNKVLYLDADILVQRDLKPLYNYNFAGYSTAMAPDPWLPEYDFVKFKKPYFNSGVMLMDLKLWRERKITQQMLKYVDKNFIRFVPNEDNRTYFNFPDQDLINIVLQGKIKQLPQTYNNFREVYDIFGDENELGTILHWVGHGKPWIYFEYSPSYLVYYKYWLECDELKNEYYYYKFFKRWPAIYRDVVRDMGEFSFAKLCQLLFVPIFIIIEFCFMISPIILIVLLGVFACAFLEGNFAKYRKWFQILFPILNTALFSYFLEWFRPRFHFMTSVDSFLLYFAIFIFVYLNLLVFHFSRENREKYYIILLLFFIGYVLYLMYRILT